MRNVKFEKAMVPAVIFGAVLALQAAPLRAQEVDVNVSGPAAVGIAADPAGPDATVVPSNYCNTKIPAPNNDKASGNEEDQMTPQWEDWIDYSGPCDQADFSDAQREMKQTSAND
jgi:hypothetical protein